MTLAGYVDLTYIISATQLNLEHFNTCVYILLIQETIGHCTAAPQLTFVPQKCVDMQTDDRLLIGEARYLFKKRLI